MKKGIGWIVMMALVLILSSCGGHEDKNGTQSTEKTDAYSTTEGTTTDENTTSATQEGTEGVWIIDPSLVGRYVCVKSYWQGESYEPDGSWYELREDGTGTEFRVTAWEFTWKSDGNTLLMVNETGRETRGIIEGDTLTVKDAQLETEYIYSRNAEEPLPSEPAISTEPAPSGGAIVQSTEIPTLSVNGEYDTERTLRGYWDRGWYGWWTVEEGVGAYSGWGDGSYWWDCCAEITWEGYNILSLILWDEDGSRQEPMAEVTLRLSPNEGRYGVAYSAEGQIWEKSLRENEWKLAPDDAVYEELLVLEGYYAAPGSKGDAFYYTIYLRPWGKLWDDWYADEPNCLPGFYESWYLPKLAAGVSTPPDKIG